MGDKRRVESISSWRRSDDGGGMVPPQGGEVDTKWAQGRPVVWGIVDQWRKTECRGHWKGCVFRAVVSTWDNFAPHGTFGNVWPPQLEVGRCYWHLWCRAQGCCYTSYNTQDSPPTKTCLAPNVNSTEAEGPLTPYKVSCLHPSLATPSMASFEDNCQ